MCNGTIRPRQLAFGRFISRTAPIGRYRENTALALYHRVPCVGRSRSHHRNPPGPTRLNLFLDPLSPSARFAEATTGHDEPAVPVTRGRQLRWTRLRPPATISQRISED